MRSAYRCWRVWAIFGCLLLTSVVIPAGAQEVTPEATVEPQAEPVWDGTFRRIQVPILMYHYVSVPPAGADEYRVDLSIRPDMFRLHMEYLFFEGYTPISLYDLHDALLTGRTLPSEPVVLTFDDGYRDAYTEVLPVLRDYNFTATFFIITARADAADPNHLNWEQIREMAQSGMSMESHTKTHPNLQGRSYDFLVYELLGSFESLQAYTGRSAHMFCYPGGDYDDETLRVAGTLPIWRAVTTENGMLHTTDNRLELPRIRVSANIGVNGLAALLRGD